MYLISAKKHRPSRDIAGMGGVALCFAFRIVLQQSYALVMSGNLIVVLFQMLIDARVAFCVTAAFCGYVGLHMLQPDI